MAIEKVITYDHHITETGHINVRQITRLMENGKELSKTYHRHVVTPDADTINEDPRTRALSKALSEELNEIMEGLEDSNVVSEGETVEGEAAKKLTWLERLKEYWSNLE